MKNRKKPKSFAINALSGRKKEMKEVLETLQKGRSIAIIAPRRFGKTALIREALQQLEGEHTSTLFIDLLINPTPEVLSTTLVREALKIHHLHKEFQAAMKSEGSFYSNKSLRNITAAFPFIARLDDDSIDKWELLSMCMKFPEALSTSLKQRTICAYDGFGNRSNSDPSGKLSNLMAAKAEHQSYAPLLISGRNESAFLPLKEIQILHLDYLEQKWLTDSFTKKFDRLKIKLPQRYIENLVRITNGHPYYSRLAFEQTILIYSLTGSIPGSKEMRNGLLAAEKDYIEKVWEDLSHNKEYSLTMLALSEGSKNIYQRLKSKKINVARAQKSLEWMGYLMKNESGGYIIADPMLKYWLRKIA